MPALKVSPKGHRYGNVPSRFSHKDYGMPFQLMTAVGPFASRVVLPGGPTSIGKTKDQGTQGSCDGNSDASVGERLFRYFKGFAITFSAAYSYYRIREYEGTLDQGDCGGQIVSAQIVSDGNPGAGGTGYCPEALMPYDENDWTSAPSDAATAAAKTYPSGSYHNMGNVLGNIKACIASGYSFQIGIAVYDSFEGDEASKSGLIPFPSSTETLLGYHALHCGMVFDDSIKCPGSQHAGAVMFQNSWSNTWGCECPISNEGGFGWLSYDYLTSQALTTDVRIQHLGPAWAKAA